MAKLSILRKFEMYGNYYRSLYNNKAGYYKKFIEVSSLADIMHISTMKHENVTESEKEIRVFGIPFNSTVSQLTKRMGKPKYRQIDNLNGLNHTTYFYKRVFFNHRTVIQFHFLNNAFFYCNIAFLDLSWKYENKLLKILREIYTGGTGTKEHLVVSDCNKNFVRYEKIVYPSIIYTNNNDNIKKAITDQMEMRKVISILESQKQYDDWRNNL